MVSRRTETRRPPHRLDLVVDFVNTLDRETATDVIATPSLLASWMREHGLLDDARSSLSEKDRLKAIELREALRHLMLANNGGPADRAAASALERAARLGNLDVHFDADASVRFGPKVGGIDQALARLLVPVVYASIDGSWARVKACRAPECLEAFYDHSPNRAGIWCDMALCGNRRKVDRYRRRARTRAE
jgi:predicted RNA-binding Zn ribbon-like protein